jgi:hypothetical protein
MGLHASVRDHLNALEEAPAWVVSLAELIQHTGGCSAAIAASRARDLSRLEGVGQAIEAIGQGWQALQKADLARLSPLQRETAETVVLHMMQEIQRGL